MKLLLAGLAFFAFALSPFAQAGSTPPISQVFAFYCNSDYSSCPDGFQPALGPIQLADGNFYGTTWYGNTSTDLGTVWQATLSGDVNVLYTFTANSSGQYINGSYPTVSFEADEKGNLYGVTLEGGTQNSGVFYSITTGGNLQVLYNFCSLPGCPDAEAPIVRAGDGNFYGITAKMIFKLSPEGAWTQFYTFPSSEEGQELIAGSEGELYGVAGSLPVESQTQSLFLLTTTGKHTVLHTFPELERVSALTQSLSGTLYGVLCCGTNTGIFQINFGGYKLLRKTPAGMFPPSLLVPGSDGNLYGLITNGSLYPGYVFALTAQGKTLFNEQFDCASDGCDPLSLMEASDGNFYGLTAVGGTVPSGNNPDGTIFKVATGLKVR